ncbi:MAPEG family protein [Aliikangiella sp. G2MR2-5]|uniref:MAPEG family protein n=1 Tax=Aliikangiella sp. G2MR2-5 TaxID=2788943 RepID=UPI0018AC625D|nr:MAPEG family protein [Aliikangiella sp. G2MR2-5]
MNNFHIQLFFPAFALVILTIFILFNMGFRRFKAAKSRKVDINYYKLYRDTDGSEPENIRKLSRNFQNLFETPIHFYLAVVLTMILNIESSVFLYTAWIYVVLRYIHSYVHCTSNNVRNRFNVYFASVLVLIAYWITLLIHVVSAM